MEAAGRSPDLPAGGRLPFDGAIPALFWGARTGSRRFVERRGKAIIFGCDLVASTLFMLSRWEEMAVPARDEHDRFPHTRSVAFRQGFLDRPVFDEYSLVIREWLKALLPGWVPKKRSHTVNMAPKFLFK